MTESVARRGPRLLGLYHAGKIMLELPIVITAANALLELEEYTRRKRVEKNEDPPVPAMEWPRFRSLPRAENPWISGP